MAHIGLVAALTSVFRGKEYRDSPPVKKSLYDALRGAYDDVSFRELFQSSKGSISSISFVMGMKVPLFSVKHLNSE